jgi:hypothetical protein
MRTFEQLTAGTLHPKIRRTHEYWLMKRAERRFATATYQRVVETKAPVCVINQEDWKGYDLQVESVTMPLSGDGARGILDAIFTAVQR